MVYVTGEIDFALSGADVWTGSDGGGLGSGATSVLDGWASDVSRIVGRVLDWYNVENGAFEGAVEASPNVRQDLERTF